MRFVAYSKFDGQPLPARNPQELEVLLQQGHHAKPPEVSSEEPAGASGGTTEADRGDERLRDEGGNKDMASDGDAVPMPPAARKWN